jgi:hypothetical protein
MKAAIKSLVLEKDKMRGLVPSRAFGNKDKVYKAYLDKLDPRNNESLQLALATSGDKRFVEFLQRLSMGQYKRVSLPSIAKACNIDLKDFSDWWNRASSQAAIAIAQQRSVDIAAHMAEDAMSIESVCERCDGLMFVAAPEGLPLETPGYRQMQSDGETVWVRTCPACNKGKVRRPGDAHARDRVLEMGGLLKRGGGVNVNMNFGGASHSSAISDLDAAMSIDI